jgi:hypothetical protein
LFRLLHKIVVIKIEVKINAPPIVGVPLLDKWLIGPQGLIICPNCILLSQVIIFGPTNNDISSEVKAANTILKVM